MATRDIPVVDVGPLVRGDDPAGSAHAARAIDAACRETGFFYIVGHGVPTDLQDRLDTAARGFFARPEEEKAEIAMAKAGRSWRGWFPVGGELTSGRPDHKEGIYFGAELGPDHPKVAKGVVLHGANLFPSEPPELGPTVLAYLDAMTALAHAVARGLALGLGLPADWFDVNLTGDPLVLFRIFHYPPDPDPASDQWGVGEHTDYGLLTLLRQDDNGGLEVHGSDGWIDAPPIENSFVCNLGDMLEKMTAGRYRSTPHRVRNTSGRSRLSFPFFFDPGWDVVVPPLPLDAGARAEPNIRWDGADPRVFQGTYGDYVTSKVARVFPDLAGDVQA